MRKKREKGQKNRVNGYKWEKRKRVLGKIVKKTEKVGIFSVMKLGVSVSIGRRRNSKRRKSGEEEPQIPHIIYMRDNWKRILDQVIDARE